MSYRMACEASELITAIVSVAGSTFAEGAECQPETRPVSVLQVHGTADTTVFYDGRAGEYPSAVETVEHFASAAGCDTSAPTGVGNVDLVSAVEGEETEQVAYTSGCQEGVTEQSKDGRLNLELVDSAIHVCRFVLRLDEPDAETLASTRTLA